MTYKVAVDDGHGLETAGKQTPLIADLGRRIKENEFNHAVKVKLTVALKRCGFEVVDLSPERTDTPLATRSSRADKSGADICVSIHYNALDDKWDNNKGGLCVFHYPGSVKGKKLAECIHKNLIKGTKQYDRGVLSENFHMVREPNMPAVLSENGFMDDRAEAALMLSEPFQYEVAEEHCMGICEYFGVPYKKEIYPVPSASVLYRVQVGAFSQKISADTLVKRLKQEGFNAFIVEQRR